MKIQREFKIENIVFTKEDIERIVNLIQSEHDILSENSKNLRVLFRSSTEDGIIFESENSFDFLSAELMQIKRTVTLDCSLTDYKNDLSVYISLSHGNKKYSGNRVSIQGQNSDWVNSFYLRLKDSFDACSPQNSFVQKHRNILCIVSAISIGRLYSIIFNIIMLIFFPLTSIAPITISSPLLISILTFFRSHYIFTSLISYGLDALVGIWPSLIMISKAEDLWPSVEFQIGPVHTYIEKKRRNIIFVIFTLGILPLIISIIYDIIKRFL